MNHCARISLQQLELNLSLGVSDAERLHTQCVKVDIDMDFLEPLRACLTDQLEDTYCYDTLAQKIAKQIAPRSFHLLEHLAYEIYHLVKQSFPQPLAVQIRVTKKPFLSANLAVASSSFLYGDK